MTCPSNPPAPFGYAVWKGSVPPSLQQWAVQLLKTVNKVPYGQTWQSTDPSGNPVLARKDYHTWHYQPDGTLLTNICWPGITLYRPVAISMQMGDSSPVYNIETATPNPGLAVYDNAPPPQGTDWTLVSLTTGAILTVAAAFALALRHAGRRRR